MVVVLSKLKRGRGMGGGGQDGGGGGGGTERREGEVSIFISYHEIRKYPKLYILTPFTVKEFWGCTSPPPPPPPQAPLSYLVAVVVLTLFFSL